jgi:signal transduction histidine kinase/DNA-binding response OmpR family regulator
MMDNTDIVNILIVDDLPEKLLVLETVLEELGQNIVMARSGPEALREVLQRDFAVILLDVNMPGMDGLETASLIRARKKSAHTPIIFITAFADEMHTARGYSQGAVDYILSPVVPEVLRTKVKVFVDLFRMTQQARRQADERVALASEQAARAAAEEATRRAAFLAEATTLLANSLDFEATLGTLLRLVVPKLADLAAVTLAGEHGQSTRSELAWISAPEDNVHYGWTAAIDGARDELQQPLGRVLATGKPEMLFEATVRFPPARDNVTLAGEKGSESLCPQERTLRWAFLLALRARGRTLGALCLGGGDSGRTVTLADQALAQDLAGRAAIALDNARLYRDVREADRLKNEFLSMLAHELRNPLAPIRNAVHVLRMRGTSEPGLEAVRDIIDRQVQQLVRLVDDLLDISRITRGKIRLQREPLELAGVIEQAVETSRPLIDAKKHALTVSLPRETVRVNGDAVRLAQVVGNLLNNAAKYTSDGGSITLSLECVEGEAVIRVSDTGIGIPPEMLGSIFDLFTQVERSLDRSQGGLGIGLTLVHRLVEMHGGRVQAFSAGANQGSEFVVRLPTIPIGAPCKPPTNGTASPPVQGPACRVLVVDDNEDGADSLALLLRLGGHKVQTCNTGTAALEMLDSFRPEIVLLDIGLPGMDGYEVARHLRMRPGMEEVLLVALTGYGQDRDIRRSREAGFDHHLVKPADPQALTDLFSRIHSQPQVG